MKHLEGDWRIERSIPNHGSLQGTAVFAPQGSAALLYTEQGIFTLEDGTGVKAVQSYLYRIEGGDLRVYFDKEGLREFHRLDFSPAMDAALATHLCGSDRYETWYRFDFPHLFTIVHRVTGPRKDYRMETRYEKTE